jgi:hypothetical protein
VTSPTPAQPTHPGQTAPPGSPADRPVGDSIVYGIDVDAVAAAVRACPGVSDLHGGRYGEVTTYLPGRVVRGVVVGAGRVRVQVRSGWGTEAPKLAAAITAALAPLTGNRPVDVAIADIDDPPFTPDWGRAGQSEPPGGPGRPGAAGPGAAGPAPR